MTGEVTSGWWVVRDRALLAIQLRRLERLTYLLLCTGQEQQRARRSRRCLVRRRHVAALDGFDSRVGRALGELPGGDELVMARSQLFGRHDLTQPLGTASQRAPQAQQPRRRRAGERFDRLERGLRLHQLRDKYADALDLLAVQGATDEPLIAAETQVACRVQRSGQLRAQRLRRLGTSAAQPGVFVRHTIQHPCDVEDLGP